MIFGKKEMMGKGRKGRKGHKGHKGRGSSTHREKTPCAPLCHICWRLFWPRRWSRPNNRGRGKTAIRGKRMHGNLCPSTVRNVRKRSGLPAELTVLQEYTRNLSIDVRTGNGNPSILAAVRNRSMDFPVQSGAKSIPAVLMCHARSEGCGSSAMDIM